MIYPNSDKPGPTCRWIPSAPVRYNSKAADQCQILHLHKKNSGSRFPFCFPPLRHPRLPRPGGISSARPLSSPQHHHTHNIFSSLLIYFYFLSHKKLDCLLMGSDMAFRHIILLQQDEILWIGRVVVAKLSFDVTVGWQRYPQLRRH